MRGFTKYIVDFISKAEPKNDASGRQVESRLRDGSLDVAWALLASRVVDGKLLIYRFFQAASHGPDSSAAAIKFMKAVAEQNEARAIELIAKNKIQALVYPGWAAECISAAMRQGLERVAETVIASSLNDSALLERMAMGSGLREVILSCLDHSDQTPDPAAILRERATPMIEALLHNFNGVACGLINAGVGFESPAMGGSFEGSIEILRPRGPSEDESPELHNLAFAIRMKREGPQHEIIERLRKEPVDSHARMALSHLGLLRMAVACGQERAVLALLDKPFPEAPRRWADQELSLPPSTGGGQAQVDVAPTLWMMIDAQMDAAAAKLIEAWSRCGQPGVAAMDRRDAQESTALRLAILKKNEPIAMLLVSAGADVRSLAGKKNPRNMAALAASFGMGRVLEAILAREGHNAGELLGADGGAEMLKEAIVQKKDSVAIELMSAGAPLPEISKGGRIRKALCWSERSDLLTAAVLARLEAMPAGARKPFLEEAHQGTGRLAQALMSGHPDRALALLKLGACYDSAMIQLGNPELREFLENISAKMDLEVKMHADLIANTERLDEEGRISEKLSHTASAARERLRGAKALGAKEPLPRSIRAAPARTL